MKKKPLCLAVGILAAVAPLSAQVTVVHTASGQADLFVSTAAGTPTTFQLDYTLQGGSSNSVLAVGFFWDQSSTTAPNAADLSAITFGGVPADRIENRGIMAVAYWFNPTGSNFAGEMTRGVAGNEAWIIHELGNVSTTIAPVVSNTLTPVSDGTTNWTLATTNDNSRIINWISLRDNGLFAAAPQAPFDSGTLSQLAAVTVDRTGTSAVPGEVTGIIASGTADASSIGSYNIGWTPGGDSDVGMALAFTSLSDEPDPDPEPDPLSVSIVHTASGQLDLFPSTNAGVSTTFQLPYTLRGGSSNSALAIGFFWDRSDITPPNASDLSAITFGGVPADGIENRGIMAVAYWFNPTGSNFSGEMTRGVGGNEAWIIHELGNVNTEITPVISNTMAPVSDGNNDDGTTDWTLTTASTHSRILNWIGVRDTIVDMVATYAVAPQAPFASGTLSELAEVAVERSGSLALPGQVIGVIASGSAKASEIGSYNIGWTPGGESDVGIALAFTSIFGEPGETDTTPPVITLTGSASIALDWGSSYSDAGATATDNLDPSVTVNSSGTVNTAKPGVYTLTYNASDLAGNAATPVTRTVTVAIANATTPGTDGTSPLLRYALGANSPTDTVQAPIINSTATTLFLTAIVRTDDPALTVGAEAVNDLTGTWGTGGTVTVTTDADQTGVPAGSTRRVFTVDTTGTARKFLRLTATLTP